jgi:hypothetical protein
MGIQFESELMEARAGKQTFGARLDRELHQSRYADGAINKRRSKPATCADHLAGAPFLTTDSAHWPGRINHLNAFRGILGWATTTAVDEAAALTATVRRVVRRATPA